MPVTTFAIYTSLGAGLWSMILLAVGYFIGNNAALIQEHLPLVTAAVLLFVIATLVGYIVWQRQPSRLK